MKKLNRIIGLLKTLGVKNGEKMDISEFSEELENVELIDNL